MQRNQQLEILKAAFRKASECLVGPQHTGISIPDYAKFVAKEIRVYSSPPFKPTSISREDAVELADALDRGDFNIELSMWAARTIESIINDPLVGDIVETVTGSATIHVSVVTGGVRKTGAVRVLAVSDGYVGFKAYGVGLFWLPIKSWSTMLKDAGPLQFVKLTRVT